MDDEEFDYLIAHVVLPPKLPQHAGVDDQDKDRALCEFITEAATEFAGQGTTSVPLSAHPECWVAPIRMLRSVALCHPTLSKDTLTKTLMDMKPGDVVALLIRAQNAGIVIRSGPHTTRFEMFEVSPTAKAVMEASGRLICSYPGPAIDVSNGITRGEVSFIPELSSFLAQMNVDVIDDAQHTTRKGGTTVIEERETTHPRYITDLLTGMLRGMGRPADVSRILKRIADDVQWHDARLPWRRSPLWLVIRVALQTTLHPEGDNHLEYKLFMAFIVAKLLRLAVDRDLPSDTLHVIQAKLSRRMRKVLRTSDVPPKPWMLVLESFAKAAKALREERWLAAQAEAAMASEWALETLDIQRDTTLSLLNSRKYLEAILQNEHEAVAARVFQPAERRRLMSPSHFILDPVDSPRAFTAALAADTPTALADFETSVEEQLDGWVQRESESLENDCSKLSAALHLYFTAAVKLYAKSPEDKSVMLLTIFDIWVAIDKLSIKELPLLAEFSPEVCPSILESLVLRKSVHVQRAARIMSYCRLREAHAKDGSVFVDTFSRHSFAVRFFSNSHELVTLKQTIEHDAKLKRDKKLLELSDLTRTQASYRASAGKNCEHMGILLLTHRSLPSLDAEAEHEYTEDQRGRRAHSSSCSKCSWAKRADSIKIEVDEWPLPEDPITAQIVVFELCPPPVYCLWRDATYRVLHDICTPPAGWSQAAKPHVLLRRYPGLVQYQGFSATYRIGLASDTKPFAKSHYSSKKVPCNANAVTVPNGLHFRLYDRGCKLWASTPFDSCDISPLCTYALPAASAYRRLQYSVNSTTHTSNFVLSTQSECPSTLDVNEFIAFGSLRSGCRLQWLNMAREISAGGLSFERFESQCLLQQAAFQISPIADGDGRVIHRMDWHVDLGDPEFTRTLLHALDTMLDGIMANWQQLTAVQTIISLAVRVLSFTEDERTTLAVYRFLQKARHVTYTWMCQLRDMLRQSSDEVAVKEYQLRLCEAACVYRGSFNVDEDHIERVLSSGHDLATFIESGIVVYENTPSAPPKQLQHTLGQDRRLSYTIEHYVIARLRTSSLALDNAIKAVWPTYSSGSPWSQMPEPGQRWLMTMTAGLSSQQVHLNILNGCLLVDGKPVNRLPRKYTDDELYQHLFGTCIVAVTPCHEPQMEFSAKDCIEGYQVLFGSRAGAGNIRVIIRARRISDGTTFELVPHHVIYGDIPSPLIEPFTHWINMHTGEIEFRPLETLWLSSDEHWRMQRLPNNAYVMRCPSSMATLVDMRSPTAQMVLAHLQPIEDITHMLLTTTGDHQLTAELPRFRLRFHVHNNELMSQNHPGFSVDRNGNVGTLIGLSSRLVLVPSGGAASARRCVIVPIGEPHIEWTGLHTRVIIEPRNSSSLSFTTFEIDNTLRRLVDDGSMLGRYMKVYLHAVTSSSLPDPLTGSTGTEKAVDELRSAASFSFQRLRPAEVEMLHRIQCLAPERTWYPKHLKVMQQVYWNPSVPASAQLDQFRVLPRAIMEHAARMELFHSDSDHVEVDTSSPLDDHLWERAASRSAGLYVASLQPVQSTADSVYASRDRLEISTVHATERQISSLASMLLSARAHLLEAPTLNSLISQWKTLEDHSHLEIAYSRTWLAIDWRTHWLTVFRKSSHASRMALVFALSPMVYRNRDMLGLAELINVFSVIPQFHALQLPHLHDAWTYDLSEGYQPRADILADIARAASNFMASAYGMIDPIPEESNKARAWRQQQARQAFDHDCNAQIWYFVARLLEQWPCEAPSMPSLLPGHDWLFSVAGIEGNIRRHFKACFRNQMLHAHISSVQNLLKSMRPNLLPPIKSTAYAVNAVSIRTRNSAPVGATAISLASLTQLRSADALSLPAPPIQLTMRDVAHRSSRSHQHAEADQNLRGIISQLKDDPCNGVHRLYGADLDQSHCALSNQYFPSPDRTPSNTDRLQQHLCECEAHYTRSLHEVIGALLPSQSEEHIMLAELWPRLNTATLLAALSYRTREKLPARWRHIAALLAESLLILQRARRLVAYDNLGDIMNLHRELDNTVPDVSFMDLDRLLIQIESNFLMRPVQLSVAESMIHPPSGGNTIQQLNMGEGKSSVIVPIVAVHLANGKSLVRVVILKALSAQMFDLLARRIGGLTQRRVYFMPFSRGMKLGEREARMIRVMYEECIESGGVLTVQPEHLLSFKLMAVEHHLKRSSRVQSPIDPAASDLIVATQRWLERKSRDILDESDEILQVKYQLVYTMGQQRPVDDNPDRWTTTQLMLSRVCEHITKIKLDFSHNIIADDGAPTCFPMIRMIDAVALDALCKAIAEDALDGKLRTCSQLSLLPPTHRRSAIRFITVEDLDDEDDRNSRSLRNHCGPLSSGWKSLLLLRGLLARRILAFALGTRRFRVDYGLDPSRSLLAVPYRAKDVPSLQAEFGHPDVCIILTCLSYYYTGLSGDQVDQCLLKLLKLDHRRQEYELWVRSSSNLPESLHQLEVINMKDDTQRKTIIHPAFRSSRTVIDFYLANVVFPKQAKEYPEKMATSGWDLAESKAHVTTGFSGTNDNRYLLPASIQQRDDPSQIPTNAQVLLYLLRPENGDYVLFPGISDRWLSTIVKDEEVTVLLDVGAQMLEYTNVQLARDWLEARHDKPAVVFFSDDELQVLTQDGALEPLFCSPFNRRLDECLVYLDDAHTRGTDLKLHKSARAAVTLGMNVTKDRLTQGCMRLRQLGHGQSFKYFAPLEVDQQIRALIPRRTPTSSVAAVDVLRWVITQTCAELVHNIPHWVKQGLEYVDRRKAWDALTLTPLDDNADIAKHWLRPDAKTLSDLYQPWLSTKGDAREADVTRANASALLAQSRLAGFANPISSAANLGEEQEREVDVEIEQEQQVERPPKAQPAEHHLHDDVRTLICYGNPPTNPAAFAAAYAALAGIISSPTEVNAWAGDLVATQDFLTTVADVSKRESAQYIRPVHWLISLAGSQSQGGKVLVLLSPFEVNELLPEIRRSKSVQLHVYAPTVVQRRVSFDNLRFHTIPHSLSKLLLFEANDFLPEIRRTKSMQLDVYAPKVLQSRLSLDDLRFHMASYSEPTLPPPLDVIMQLNLMAGQLYLPNFEAYAMLLDFLGVVNRSSMNAAQELPEEVQGDGFVLPQYRTGRMLALCRFKESPLPFIREILGLRRKGASYFPTHLGKILSVAPLAADDFADGVV